MIPSGISTHRGRPSKSGPGKRRRNAADKSAGPGDGPGESGQGCRLQTRARARGRNQRPDIDPKSARAGRHDKSTTTTTTTAISTETTPYDRAFTQHLLDHNILSIVHRSPSGSSLAPPDNLQDIKAKLGVVRTQDSADDFEWVSSDNDGNVNKNDAATLLDKLQGDNAALYHTIRRKTIMHNLAPLTDGSIPPGNPDRTYGAAPSELHNNVRRLLQDMIVPTRDKDFICPNFVVHLNSEDRSAKVVRGQATHDGAPAARGMQSLWDYENGPDGQVQEDRVARTITCTWESGVLKMYAVYRQQDSDTGEEACPGEQESDKFPIYISSLVGSWIMTDEENQFLQGLTAYRNGLDWAKRQRDEAISRANARARAEKVLEEKTTRIG